jgi:hypothetical protein
VGEHRTARWRTAPQPGSGQRTAKWPSPDPVGRGRRSWEPRARPWLRACGASTRVGSRVGTHMCEVTEIGYFTPLTTSLTVRNVMTCMVTTVLFRSSASGPGQRTSGERTLSAPKAPRARQDAIPHTPDTAHDATRTPPRIRSASGAAGARRGAGIAHAARQVQVVRGLYHRQPGSGATRAGRRGRRP